MSELSHAVEAKNWFMGVEIMKKRLLANLTWRFVCTTLVPEEFFFFFFFFIWKFATLSAD